VILPILVLLLAAGSPSPPGPGERDRDEVRLKDGRVLRGRVVYEDEGEILLRVGSREQSIPVRQVDSLRSVARSLGQWVERHRALPKGDRAAAAGLARWCGAEGLEAESRLEWLGVLALAPGDAEANEALGHRRAPGGGWLLPYKTGWWPLERLEKVRAEWNDAWELETEHYLVRTNLGWKTALDAALDMEFFLHDFFRAFSRELRLREVEEPMKVDLHRDPSSFPEIGSNRPSYFDPSENRVLLRATGGVHPDLLYHEATHQVLFTTAARARSGTGAVPDWLSEGLAEYVAAGVSGEPGRLSFTTGARAGHHFREHARAEKPYDLSRVLQFEAADFLASSKSPLKYAQVYTLVHFCLHGEEGKFRDRFLAFVAGAYRGQGSATDFKKAIGEREEAFERAWHAYARAGAAK
jgi:hypothetical protein